MIDGAVKVAGTLRVPSAAYRISCNYASLMIRQIRPKADGTWKVPATVAGTLRVPSAIYPFNRNDSSVMFGRFQCRADGTWKVPATFQHEDIAAELAHELDEEAKQ